MTLRRLLAALFTLLAGSIALAPAANAAPAYPPAIDGGLIVPADITVGEIHVLVGTGFQPGSQVTVTVSREDRNGDPDVRGFSAGGGAPVVVAGPVTGRVTTATAPQGWTAPLPMACAQAASCVVTVDAAGRAAFPVHFYNSDTYVITVTGVSPDGAPRVLRETIVPETGCDESDGGDTEVADTSLVPDCDAVGGSGSDGSASGVGGSGSLPDTGASIGVPLTAGAILVLVGAGLVTVVRRRRTGDATA